MINTIFINGLARYNGKERADLPPLTDEIVEIALIFDSEDELKSFTARFPKYMKINPSRITSFTDKGAPIKQPYTKCRKMRPNLITGAANEIGDKKMNRFYNVVKELIKK